MKPETKKLLEQVKAMVAERKAAGWQQEDFIIALCHEMRTGKELPITPRPSESKP